MEQSGKKHNFEVLPPSHLDSREIVALGFITSVSVIRPSDRQHVAIAVVLPVL